MASYKSGNRDGAIEIADFVQDRLRDSDSTDDMREQYQTLAWLSGLLGQQDRILSLVNTSDDPYERASRLVKVLERIVEADAK